MPDRLFSATQQREVESLMHELETVARVTHEHDEATNTHVLRYHAKQLGLFGDRVLPAEIEVMRTLRTLAELGRLLIVREQQKGKRVVVSLRSGLEVTILPLRA